MCSACGAKAASTVRSNSIFNCGNNMALLDSHRIQYLYVLKPKGPIPTVPPFYPQQNYRYVATQRSYFSPLFHCVNQRGDKQACATYNCYLSCCIQCMRLQLASLAKKKKKEDCSARLGKAELTAQVRETQKAYKIIKAHFSSSSPAAVVQRLKRRA